MADPVMVKSNRIVRGKPVFTIVTSESLMRRFIQEDRESLRGKTEAYTPVQTNKMNAGLFHLRVYKSPTSALLLPADRAKKREANAATPNPDS